MSVLQVDEFLIARKEIAGFQIRVSDFGWIDLFLIKLQHAGAVGMYIRNQHLLILGCRSTDDGHLLGGIEEIINLLLELLFNAIPIPCEQDIVLLRRPCAQ